MLTIPPLLQTKGDLDQLLQQAMTLAASDVHIGGDDPIKLRCHGVLHNATRTLTTTEVNSLLVASYDSVAAIAQINSGQELDFGYSCHGLRWRVNAGSRRKAGRRNTKLVFRAIQAIPPNLEILALEPEIVTTALAMTKGLAIVTGATGSGKSTLLAALLRRRLELQPEHLITCEAPIEYVYDDVALAGALTAQEIGLGGDHPSFSAALIAALRKDPDLILVGEARDRATIEAALHGAETGHALFTTCHTNGVANTMSRLLKVFPAGLRAGIQMDLVDNLKLVIYQTLVPAVDGTRTALREYLVVDQTIRQALRDCSNTALFATCQQHLTQTLTQHAAQKLAQGLISQQVYQRIQLGDQHG